MKVTIQKNIMSRDIFRSILFCVVFTGLFVIFSFAKNFIPNNSERLAHGIIGTLAAILTIILFLKFDRKRFCDIGLTFKRNTIVKFFLGVVAGIVIAGVLAASVVYFTHLKVVANPRSNFLNFLLMTSPLIPLAFMEELGFRSYPLERLKDKVGIKFSIIITSILFALYHIANGWTIASSFYGPGVWGLIFGLAAIYSKGVAMPTGIHYAVNLTTSALGGKNTTANLWTVEQADNTTVKYGTIDWATILPAISLLFFAIICIEVYMRRRTISNR